ncbi:MAG: outer membrane beta-barrel protein [Bacteroidota bacterium]|nr:outer membrane beta-barrel protein [Bacteroidota bacterium]
MLKNFFICLLFCTSFIKINAQQGFRFGPNAFVISSRVSIQDSLPDNFNFRFKSGFGFGVTFQYGFESGISLSTGANFVSKGYRVFNDTNRNGDVLKQQITNIEIPLNLTFIIKHNSSSDIRGVVGMNYNTVLSKKDRMIENKNKSFIIKESFKQEAYPMVNLGVEVAKLNKIGNAMVFGLYYRHSFSSHTLLDISRGEQSPSYFQLGYRGSYIGIGFSYLFNSKNLKKNEEFFY